MHRANTLPRDRTPHVSEYRLRVGDELDLVYRLTREERPEPYRINVGDEIRVESMADPTLDRELIVQPDGMITLRLLGQVKANGLTVAQLGSHVEEAYKKYYKTPSITVTPVKVDTKLEDLRAAVDRRMGLGGQSQIAKITPEGSISLPGIGWVYVQGLTLAELQVELDQRYADLIPGMEVMPVIVSWAPRYAYVLGEVGNPGKFELTGPTTILQAVAMAGAVGTTAPTSNRWLSSDAMTTGNWSPPWSISAPRSVERHLAPKAKSGSPIPT